MSTMATVALTYPHPTLTPIEGKPSFVSLVTLKREVYANARSIYCPAGGNDGHLGLVMSDADYTARTGAAFVPPVHPGAQPAHAPAATQAQILAADRTYDKAVEAASTAHRVKVDLQKMLLDAIGHTYLQQLEDDVFGFSDVTPQTIMAHLETTYGTMNQEDIEKNRETLSEVWSPEDPIEDLWTRITQAQRIATRAGEAIPDAAVIRLTLKVLEDTGVFANGIDKWRDKAEADRTLVNFKTHFNRENKERLRKLTAKTAGYHGANQALTNNTQENLQETSAVATTKNSKPPSGKTATNPFGVNVGNNRTMYYCWTHGLGKNPNHTSPNCKNKATGHQDTATADNLMGGNDRIMSGRKRTQN